MSKGPIIAFKDQSELDACLREWQTRLFLDDWVIKAAIVAQSDMEQDKNNAGECSFQIVNQCAAIRIRDAKEYPKNCMCRQCQEKTLVHELLHCKYNWVESDYGSIAHAYYDALEHGLIEQMAKSLIMAKYGINFDWFKA